MHTYTTTANAGKYLWKNMKKNKQFYNKHLFVN